MLCWSESLRRSCLISEISLLLKRPRKVPRMAPAAAAATKICRLLRSCLMGRVPEVWTEMWSGTL